MHTRCDKLSEIVTHILDQADGYAKGRLVSTEVTNEIRSIGITEGVKTAVVRSDDIQTFRIEKMVTGLL